MKTSLKVSQSAIKQILIYLTVAAFAFVVVFILVTAVTPVIVLVFRIVFCLLTGSLSFLYLLASRILDWVLQTGNSQNVEQVLSFINSTFDSTFLRIFFPQSAEELMMFMRLAIMLNIVSFTAALTVRIRR